MTIACVRARTLGAIMTTKAQGTVTSSVVAMSVGGAIVGAAKEAAVMASVFGIALAAHQLAIAGSVVGALVGAGSDGAVVSVETWLAVTHAVDADSTVCALIRARASRAVVAKPPIKALARATLTNTISATVVRTTIHGVLFSIDVHSA